MKRIGIILMTTCALASAPLAAGKAGTDEALSRTVHYAELDLTNPKAIEILHRRLTRAAEEVCAPMEGRELWRLRERRRCVAAALTQAVRDVNRPLLTQYHQQRNAALPDVAAR